MSNKYIEYYKDGEIQRLRTIKSYVAFKLRIYRQDVIKRLKIVLQEQVEQTTAVE